MIIKLLTEHHLAFLSLTGGRTGSSESTLVKMSNCWKSHAAAQFLNEKVNNSFTSDLRIGIQPQHQMSQSCRHTLFPIPHCDRPQCGLSRNWGHQQDDT